MFPLARHHDLTIRALPDELLIFDRKNNKAHCLNATAALVWRHCDGRTSLAELGRILEQQLHIPADVGIVQLALAQLGRRRLLDEATAPVPPQRVSRRDLLKKGTVALVALPLVMSLTAPHASAAASLAGDCSGPCVKNEDCWAANPIGSCTCQFGWCNP